MEAIVSLCASSLFLGASALAATCSPDSVKVGPVCVDLYEARVWQIPAAEKKLIAKVQQGKADLRDLQRSGATQLGCSTSPFSLTDYPAGFPENGNWTDPVYAVSSPGVLPSTCITWFQAAQACALSGKRLLTTQEWQQAAAGTPDPGDPDNNTTDCETGFDTGASDPASTGSRASCVSKWGAFDMVGNIWEWVGDWDEPGTVFGTWPAGDFGADTSGFGGTGTGGLPGALFRGGDWDDGAFAGVFAVGVTGPAFTNPSFGFRSAR